MGKLLFLASCFKRCPARVNLALMVILGLINAYMVRVNLSVAIVAMVRQPSLNTSAVTTTTTTTTNNNNNSINDNNTIFSDVAWVTTVEQHDAGNDSIKVSPALLVDPEEGGLHKTTREEEGEEEKGMGKKEEDENRYDWDEWVQGLVLGSFFYAYWISQVGGGRLAEVFGTKVVLGVTVLSGGVAAILTPLAARLHYTVLITLRTVQGFLQGATIPCVFPLIVRWIPRFERAKFIACVLFCNNISITFTLAICGLLIDALGWESVFYVTGVSSIAWCLMWYFFMYETPQEHPRITKEELEHILKSQWDGGSESKDSNHQPPSPPLLSSPSSPSTSSSPSSSPSSSWSSAPWLSIFTSLPVWALMMCEMGNSFGYSLFFSYLPTYLQTVQGVNISENGLLSALPFLSRYLGGVLFSTFGEWLLSRGYLSVVNARRLFSSVAMLGPAAVLITLAYSQDLPTSSAVSLMCLGFFLNGSVTVGVFANKAELSLYYAGTVSGLGNTSANIVSFIVPFIVGAILSEQQTVRQWQAVFWVCVPVYVVCELFFFIFVSGNRQSWDVLRDPQQKRKSQGQEDASEMETRTGDVSTQEVDIDACEKEKPTIDRSTGNV